MASILFGLMILIKGQSQNHEGFADISKTESSSDNSKDSKTILFSGYVVPQLNAFDATINDQVLRMTESGNLRAPRDIVIHIQADPQMTGATKIQKGVKYKIENLGSGSGGAEWELTAIKSFGNQSVQVSARMQTEAEKPYFEWAWLVIDGIKSAP